MKAISASSARVIQYRAPANHSKIMSDKPDEGHLIDKIAIPKRRKFFVGQVTLRPKEPIEE
jgi:hypothetical protein